MSIKRLPNWVITSKNPAFYDTESKTVLEQTARLYAVIQDLIDAYNLFEADIIKSVEEFKADSKGDANVFKMTMEQKFHDFKEAIEEKITSQDAIIQDSVVYIKDNLKTYIEANVLPVLQELIEDGALDDELNTIFDELSSRINILEESDVSITITGAWNKNKEDYTSDEALSFLNAYKSMKSKNKITPIVVKFTEDLQGGFIGCFRDLTTNASTNGYLHLYVTKMFNNLSIDDASPIIQSIKYNIELVNGVPTINEVVKVAHNFLSLKNTIEYTPTGDYNPATKKYVDDKIANIEFSGDVDLSNYYTKEEVDTAISENVPEVDLTGYATEEYVDDKTQIIELTCSNSFSGGASGSDTTLLASLNENAEKISANPKSVYRITNGTKTYDFVATSVSSTSIILNNVIASGNPASRLPLMVNYVSINYTKTDDLYSFTYCSVNSKSFDLYPDQYTTASSVLTKTNTTSYTPSSDYHPATKKYVDDSVGALTFAHEDYSSLFVAESGVTLSTCRVFKHGGYYYMELEGTATNGDGSSTSEKGFSLGRLKTPTDLNFQPLTCVIDHQACEFGTISSSGGGVVDSYQYEDLMLYNTKGASASVSFEFRGVIGIVE